MGLKSRSGVVELVRSKGVSPCLRVMWKVETEGTGRPIVPNQHVHDSNQHACGGPPARPGTEMIAQREQWNKVSLPRHLLNELQTVHSGYGKNEPSNQGWPLFVTIVHLPSYRQGDQRRRNVCTPCDHRRASTCSPQTRWRGHQNRSQRWTGRGESEHHCSEGEAKFHDNENHAMSYTWGIVAREQMPAVHTNSSINVRTLRTYTYPTHNVRRRASHMFIYRAYRSIYFVMQ